jgi:hypothetical protein
MVDWLPGNRPVFSDPHALGWHGLEWRLQPWLLKNSFSGKTDSNPVIQNVYSGRDDRL